MQLHWGLGLDMNMKAYWYWSLLICFSIIKWEWGTLKLDECHNFILLFRGKTRPPRPRPSWTTAFSRARRRDWRPQTTPARAPTTTATTTSPRPWKSWSPSAGMTTARSSETLWRLFARFSFAISTSTRWGSGQWLHLSGGESNDMVIKYFSWLHATAKSTSTKNSLWPDASPWNTVQCHKSGVPYGRTR